MFDSIQILPNNHGTDAALRMLVKFSGQADKVHVPLADQLSEKEWKQSIGFNATAYDYLGQLLLDFDVFYMVGINNAWTTVPQTLSQIEAPGFTIQLSRTHGEYQMFLDGQMCGWLFLDKAEQAKFLHSKDLI